MAISRFQSAFKVRTDMMDNITPNNTVQMNASVPAGEWKPAAWLPTIWQNEASKDLFVISSGKVVSLDASGRVVPSGLLKRLATAAHGATIISYDQSDVDAKVMDIRTGKPVLKAAIGNVDSKTFCQGVLDLGWVISALNPAAGGGSSANCQAIGRQFISAPVGIAAYDVYVWAGDDPANLHFTNYQKQHLIQFFTDIQMRVAHVCEPTASNIFAATKKAGAALQALSRYSDYDLSDVMAYEYTGKLASNTSRTPVSLEIAAAGAFASSRERSDLSLVVRAGDWYVDADAGRIFFYLAGGAANNPVDSNGAALAVLTAFDYSATESASEKMMHLVGNAKAGDFVTFDKNSNFIVRDMAAAEDNVDASEGAVEAALAAVRDEHEWTVGRVLAFQKEPRGLLERVRTGWSGSEFGADAQMPGSATKGFSDLITLSTEVIADEIAIVNVKIQ